MSVKIVFLGTGSGKPTPYRSVSSVALFRNGDLFMFDCGEGAQTQLARSPLKPGRLEAVLLTHFHGDHVNGLPGFLGSLTLNQRQAPLDVVGPRGLKKWFKTLRDLSILWPGFRIDTVEVEESGVVLRGEDWRIETMPLRHRIEAWGYAFIEDDRPGRFDVEHAKALGVPSGPLFGDLQRGQTITLDNGDEIRPDQVLGPKRPGLKIVYCTDTTPCDEAVALAEDADLLIHESTYPAGEEKLAHQRGHSTAGDAARCARAAGARRLVLTHFSQKYPRTELFVDGAREIFENTEAARDLLEIEVDHRQ